MPQHRTEEFATPAPITVRVTQASGTLDVRAEQTGTTTVDLRGNGGESIVDKAVVELRGDELVIEVPDRTFGSLRRSTRLAITVVVPEGSGLLADLASADVTCRGPLGRLHVETASGDVRAGDVTGDVTAHSASGDVAIGHTGGTASVRSMSGDVSLASAAKDIDAHTASGDIAIGAAGASVRARTASGDIAVGVAHQGTVEINSASGDLAVGVGAGAGVWLDVSSMSGDTATDLAVGDQQPTTGCDLRITARTTSGDIRIHRAAAQRSV